MGALNVPVSPGEVADKVSILLIKARRILPGSQRENVLRELEALRLAWDEARLPAFEALPGWLDLVAVNEALWDIEDELRACETIGDFGPRFVALARAVYRTNDRRAAYKRVINEALGSALIEEKSYGSVASSPP